VLVSIDSPTNMQLSHGTHVDESCIDCDRVDGRGVRTNMPPHADGIGANRPGINYLAVRVSTCAYASF